MLTVVVLASTSALGSAASTHDATKAAEACSLSTAPRFIVQAQTAAVALEHVAHVGGTTCRRLNVINGVSAALTAEQAKSVRALPGVRVSEDRNVASSGALAGTLTQATTVFTDGTAVFGAANKLATNYRMLVSADDRSVRPRSPTTGTIR